MPPDCPKPIRVTCDAAIAVTACLLVAVSACTTPNSRAPEPALVDVPAAWSATDLAAASGAAKLAAWWTRFDDPMLARLVSDALRANTSVASAQAALRQARALRDMAAATLYPTLGSSASAQRSRDGTGASSIGGTSTNSLFQAGLDANWELDIFGVNRSVLNAGDAAARASAATLGTGPALNA